MSRVKKIVVLGAIGSGKSSLLKKLTGLSFTKEEAPTMGLRIYTLLINEANCDKLVFWELTSAGKLETQPEDYLKGAHAALYVFDLSRPSTYVNLIKEKRLLNDMMPNIPIIMVANKMDLISTGQKEKIIAQFDSLELVPVSAKNDHSENELLANIKNGLL